jgi:hypothetical protein
MSISDGVGNAADRGTATVRGSTDAKRHSELLEALAQPVLEFMRRIVMVVLRAVGSARRLPHRLGVVSVVVVGALVAAPMGAMSRPAGAGRQLATRRVVDLMAVVATHAKRLDDFPVVSDVLVAHVTGTGGVRVLSLHRVLRGRIGMNPSQARIAPISHKIAFVYSNDRDQLNEGIAVMNANGSDLHVLMKPGFGVIWDINWDAAGDRLLAVDWRNATDVLEFNTDTTQPRAHRVFSTNAALFDACFVGWSRSTLLLQISTTTDYVDLYLHGKLRRLERAKVYLLNPVASRSGASFVYSDHLYPGGPFAVRQATIAHPHQFHRVVLQEADDPQYSPGQTRLFYSYRDDSGNQNRYLVHWAWLSGSKPHNVHFPGTYRSIRFGGITNE